MKTMSECTCEWGPCVCGWCADPSPADELRAERDALQIDVKRLSELFAASQKDVEVLQARVTELERLLNNATHLAQDEGDAREAHRERANTLERELTVARKWAAAWKDCAPRAREYKRLWENEYEKSNSLEKRVADLVHALDEETQRCVKAEKRVKELEAYHANNYLVSRENLAETIAALVKRCENSERERDAAIAVLKRVEWSRQTWTGEWGQGALALTCPVCGSRQPGHAPDCALAACLKGET